MDGKGSLKSEMPCMIDRMAQSESSEFGGIWRHQALAAPSTDTSLDSASDHALGDHCEDTSSPTHSGGTSPAHLQESESLQECLACGYQYTCVHELADHQRSTHGLEFVIW
jgi:hypothetical protein